MPGALKLVHLQPIEPILFSKFYNFFTFIPEANSYYPRGLIMRKGNSSNSRNGLEREVSVPGAFKLDHLQPVKPILFSKFYNFFTFILGANSYYPREGMAENGKMEISQPECEIGISVSNWTICSLLSQFCSPIFPIFSTFILGVQFLLP